MARKEKKSVAEFGTLFREFMNTMVAQAVPLTNPLVDRLAAHLGGELSELAVIAEEFETWDHPNLQVALDAYVAERGRSHQLLGIGVENKRFMAFGLSDLLGRAGGQFGRLGIGPVDYTNFSLDDHVLACVHFGIYLISAGPRRLAVMVSGPGEQGGPRRRLRVEVMSPRAADAQGLLDRVKTLMAERNVYRGKTISLAPGQMGVQSLVAFHSLPSVTRADVVLPDGVLERIERHTVSFARHAPRLRRAGRSLKRGLLLFGPPGVGKTLTVMHLAGQMPGRTVILATGRGLGLVSQVCGMARALAPSLVVLEDVDMVAEDRMTPPGARTGPVLVELLNEMDGLREDVDVIFLLTTNRPEVLEPALAARPGRVDLAVELPLPEADGRRRLFELYGRGLDLHAAVVEPFVKRTAGASPAFIKELLRKAAVIAAERARGPVRVSAADLESALDELVGGGELAQRILGYRQMENLPDLRGLPPLGTPGVSGMMRARPGGWIERS